MRANITDNVYSPERVLFLEIIRQAIDDITRSRIESVTYAKAHWFLIESRDYFYDICLWAGLSPELVREEAQYRIAKRNIVID